MLDITTENDLGRITNTLNIKYRFNGFPYLVADKNKNFYILPHCPNKRTIKFKVIGKRSDYVWYHGDKKYMNKLNKVFYIVDEKINVNLDM